MRYNPLKLVYFGVRIPECILFQAGLTAVLFNLSINNNGKGIIMCFSVEDLT